MIIEPLSSYSSVKGVIELPYSKSIRARLLIINALNDKLLDIDEKDCRDIKILHAALKQILETKSGEVVTVDVQDSGTALRFLTAFCALRRGAFVITGTDRLCMRPIDPLVDALKHIGANINYTDKYGFAPLRIKGCKIKGTEVSISAIMSSQFVSALMLIAPVLPHGLVINMLGKPVSASYIKLTTYVLKQCGVDVQIVDRVITIPRSTFRLSNTLWYERDWSSAAVWYSMLSIIEDGSLVFNGLNNFSPQPDVQISSYFEQLGVKTLEHKQGVEIQYVGYEKPYLFFDCINNPDAIMPIAVAAAVKEIPFEIQGANTLSAKESNRTMALVSELAKCGYDVKSRVDSLRYIGGRFPMQENVTLNAYNDHRMAMSLALIGLRQKIVLDGQNSVVKSYPNFWKVFNSFCKISDINDIE